MFDWNSAIKFTEAVSHQRCSVKKAVIENFAIFTGKQLC